MGVYYLEVSIESVNFISNKSWQMKK